MTADQLLDRIPGPDCLEEHKLQRTDSGHLKSHKRTLDIDVHDQYSLMLRHGVLSNSHGTACGPIRSGRMQVGCTVAIDWTL